jgi:alkyl hydroperoxide reductase subunit AhpF
VYEHKNNLNPYPRIFAAGDVTNAFGNRIIIACGEGAKAAMAARQFILNIRKRKEATEARGKG